MAEDLRESGFYMGDQAPEVSSEERMHHLGHLAETMGGVAGRSSVERTIIGHSTRTRYDENRFGTTLGTSSFRDRVPSRQR